MNELLRVENLSKGFGAKRVLRGLDFGIEAGRVYGLLGRNGEGKTTLIRILMGVIPSDGGIVLHQGRRVGFRDSAYKREFGYVPEDPFFYGWMTVGGIMEFNSRFYPRWDRKRAASDLERFGLDPKSRVRTLSRGMKLKLELAMALAAGPRLLLLDDPTSGLDVPTRQEFLRDVIRELASAGTAVLFATHLVHELERIVDRLLILHGGRLVLDEDYEKVQNLTRRVVLGFENASPGDPGLDHVIRQRRDGNELEIIVYPWTEEGEKTLRAMNPARLDIETLRLEDIFASFVSRP